MFAETRPDKFRLLHVLPNKCAFYAVIKVQGPIRDIGCILFSRSLKTEKRFND